MEAETCRPREAAIFQTKLNSMEDFQKLAQSEAQGNIVTEFWHFLGQTKKWWLVPILLVVLAFAALVFFSGTAAAPFIYTLF